MQTCRGSHTHTVVTDPQRQGQRLHLRVRVVAACARPRSCPAARTAPIDDPNTRAVPPRSDQGAARGAGEGGDRQLAAHLQRPRAAAAAAPSRGRGGAAAARLAPRRGDGCAGAARRGRCAGGGARRGRRCAGCSRGGGRRRAAAAADAAARRTGPESVPRHHRLSGHRSGRRRVRRLRPAARHPRRRAIRCASTRRPTSTCRSGTRRRSATTARRCCSPTSGAAASQPRCRDTDKLEWGADALFTIENSKMMFKSYYKMPARADGARELRRAQRLADSDPRPRVMVQGWYQGGISVFDWTDVAEAEGDRVLRSRPGRRDAAGHAAARGRSTGTTA